MTSKNPDRKNLEEALTDPFAGLFDDCLGLSTGTKNGNRPDDNPPRRTNQQGFPVNKTGLRTRAAYLELSDIIKAEQGPDEG